MSEQFQQAEKQDGFEASIEEKQLYSIKKAVIGLIEFVTTSLDQLGIDKLHELVDPSLDELHGIIMQLDAQAKVHGDLNLNQALLFAQILINDIKQKNPEMCAHSSRMLKSAQIL
ncbi:Uncharacterised protein [Serratia marcescens]|uniref:hypothetical protein n=1 Tax=Serratia marcescens TaxID=615 RepID=UPI0007454371|nr:hypothetical protein [Serratia marcescens]CUY13566.1 Uncharacterised protein [Serratia marcescens]CUZ00894.1 Uncharacterised protein [Serratia marcescens]CUZ29803.1 Uncharacterised protein [Serratia marcescens]CUZ42660.1 Uncharacterised protein [Serratia marcescens]CVA36732.1 Uncharacterised protein [Serratia marcescens]